MVDPPYPDDPGRRRFLKNTVTAFLGGGFGISVVYAHRFPTGLLPVVLQHPEPFVDMLGKDTGMRLLNDRPWNLETPAHLLDDPVTPAERLFVRNNGTMPVQPDPNAWTVRFDGESCPRPTDLSLNELKSNFETVSYQLVLECAGNGRSEFNPPASGNQWTTGAVGCPLWTGVRLRDVLEAVGVRDDAVYVAYYGADIHLSGDRNTEAISRGVPMAKALEDESLLAWEMNGKALPLAHGFPLRLVFGGWPGSVSGKWINRIVIRDRVHDGQKMGGKSYRVPRQPIAPGSDVPDEAMEIIHAMPVKSLITRPKSGVVLPLGKSLSLGGHAWGGEGKVQAMDISIDFGATWKSCRLRDPANRFAWQQWEAEANFPRKGYYEVWARATDDAGRMQPMIVPGWNPRGYLNNACHRIAVRLV